MRDGSPIPDDVLRDDGKQFAPRVIPPDDNGEWMIGEQPDNPLDTMPMSGLLYYREKYRRHAELFEQLDREIARRERAVNEDEWVRQSAAALETLTAGK